MTVATVREDIALLNSAIETAERRLDDLYSRRAGLVRLLMALQHNEENERACACSQPSKQ